MTATQLLVAALATWQAVEVWHHSSLFTAARARWEARGGFLGDLLGCPWCLSVWVGAAAALLPAAGWWMRVWAERAPGATPGSAADLLCGLMWLPGGAAWLFAHALAVSRLANLGNDLTRRWCRTPKTGFEAGRERPDV